MSVDEFYDMTPREFSNKLIGFNEHIEFLQEQEWLRARTVAFYTITPHAKKGRIKSPKDLFLLGTEKKNNESPPMTNEEALNLAKKWQQRG